MFLRNRPEDVGLRAVGVERGSAEDSFRSTGTLRWRLMLGSRDLWHLGLLYTFYGFTYIIFFTFFAAHLKDRGLGLEETSAMWGWLGWIGLPTCFAWGWVSDTIGRRYGLAIVYSLLGLAMLVFAAGASQLWYIVALILYGVAGLAVPAIMAAASGDYVPPRFAPAALGMVTVLFGIGQATGPWVAGALRDSTGSFTPSFYLAAAVSVLAALIALRLKSPQIMSLSDSAIVGDSRRPARRLD